MYSLYNVMKQTATEITFIVLILAVLVFFINPFMGWMPSALHYMLAGGLFVLVTLFTGFVWREQANDEREELHRFISARFAYLVGVAILTVGILLQSITRVPDVWLVATLAAMILAKLAGHFYSRTTR